MMKAKRRKVETERVSPERVMQCLDATEVGIVICQWAEDKPIISYSNESGGRYLHLHEEDEHLNSSSSTLPEEFLDALKNCHRNRSQQRSSFRTSIDGISFVIEACTEPAAQDLYITTMKSFRYNLLPTIGEPLEFWVQQCIKDIFDLSQTSCVIVDADEDVQDLKVAFCTDRWIDTFVPGKECDGKWVQRELGMEVNNIRMWFKEILKTMKLEDGQAIMENEVILPNGEKVWAQNRCRYLYSLDNKGNYHRVGPQETTSLKVHRFINISNDVTEKKRFEAMAHLTKQLIDANDIVMAVVEPLEDGHFKWHLMNKKAMETVAMMVGHTDTKFVETATSSKTAGLTLEHLKMYRDVIGKLKDSGKKQFTESISDPVAKREYLCTACEVGAELFGLILIDVTDIRETEKQVKEKETLIATQSKFLAIRTPLTGIIETLNHFLEKRLSEEDLDILNMGKGCSEQLLCVINDILDYSKIEYNEITLEIQSVLLQGVIEESLDIVTMQANKKHLPLICMTDFDVGTQIHADRGRLRQIMCNLLTNAIKFTEKGQVVLSGRIFDENTLEISVKDTGIGISESFKSRVFNPFEQSDSTITRRYGGTGLGLSICKKFCQSMGGDITVVSEEGKGATFIVRLPFSRVSPTEESAALTLMEEQLQSTCQTAGRIAIVVEPQPAQAEMLRKTLEGLRFTVRSFHHVDEIPATAAVDEVISVVILDTPLMKDRERVEGQFTTAKMILVEEFAPGLTVEGESKHHVLSKPLRRRQIVKMLHRLTVAKIQTPMKNQTQQTPNELKGLKVMVAEDNVTNQKVIQRILSRIGVKDPHIVDNGEQSVQASMITCYHLILMDCNMPVKSGVDATKDIRALQRKEGGRQSVIVALTADTSSANHQLCMDAGMNEVLTKPVRIEKLKQVILDVYNQIGLNK
ncbi:Signal transduction histidine kinase [Planoprotostelium fungivorum]|uniref:Signal transduction histidine kinase n=1 Tax=Planoprotostelium fungivorum TaxID=1890364 RepID=A0A2P6NZ86_9EUKA|nr:Signal transduction histidine kinase [Planoprotostelium fungivorum]